VQQQLLASHHPEILAGTAHHVENVSAVHPQILTLSPKRDRKVAIDSVSLLKHRRGQANARACTTHSTSSLDDAAGDVVVVVVVPVDCDDSDDDDASGCAQLPPLASHAHADASTAGAASTVISTLNCVTMARGKAVCNRCKNVESRTALSYSQS
jgi:hypothetical protein